MSFLLRLGNVVAAPVIAAENTVQAVARDLGRGKVVQALEDVLEAPASIAIETVEAAEEAVPRLRLRAKSGASPTTKKSPGRSSGSPGRSPSCKHHKRHAKALGRCPKGTTRNMLTMRCVKVGGRVHKRIQ